MFHIVGHKATQTKSIDTVYVQIGTLTNNCYFNGKEILEILLLAPHPFYQNRGTPIAVDLLIQSLLAGGHNIDLLTFNEGADRPYANLRIFRVGNFLGIKGVRPGFSLKKIVLDLFMFIYMFKLIRANKYDMVHAVEESVFIASLYSLFTKVPIVYDMDSSMVTQLVDKYTFLRVVEKPLRWIESIPIKRSCAVLPVCEALEKQVITYRRQNVFLLKDISMLDKNMADQLEDDLKKELVNLRSLGDPHSKILLYVGNLESYQGIDLMIESFSIALKAQPKLKLVIVGGAAEDISHYQKVSQVMNMSGEIFFLGLKPIELLFDFCRQAQLLLSPRISGENTPMKIYSYLDSGIPVLATNLLTHSEVINSEIGFLADPHATDFGAQIVEILVNYDVALTKAAKAMDFIAREHSKSAYMARVQYIYNQITPNVKE